MTNFIINIIRHPFYRHAWWAAAVVGLFINIACVVAYGSWANGLAALLLVTLMWSDRGYCPWLKKDPQP